jgi:hypothetical protein
MRRLFVPQLAALCGLVTATAVAQPTPGTPLSFITCPIVRDMGPNSEICFFIEHEGVTYGITPRSGFGSPQLKHRVLVEGRVVDGPKVCGGVPFEGRVSVLQEIDLNCNQIVPYDGKSPGRVSGLFHSGLPEQLALTEELTRRAKTDPSATVTPAIYVPPPPPPPKPPYEERRLTIHYPFAQDRGPGGPMGNLVDLARYAAAIRARSVTIVGQAGSSKLSNGEVLTEDLSLARTRAQKAADIMIGLGVPAKVVHVSWNPELVEGTGVDDWRNRKIEVIVKP